MGLPPATSSTSRPAARSHQSRYGEPMTMAKDQPRDWHIRPPREEDYASWRILYQGYADFYGVQQSEAMAATVWSWIHDPDHEISALLAETENQVVGLAHYRPYARPLTASTGCFLDDLFVAESHRGAGAADALLTELRNITSHNGWSLTRWVTAEDNYRGRAKYDQHATRTAWVTYDMTPEPR